MRPLQRAAMLTTWRLALATWRLTLTTWRFATWRFATWRFATWRAHRFALPPVTYWRGHTPRRFGAVERATRALGTVRWARDSGLCAFAALCRTC
jgi:hypothetical protein